MRILILAHFYPPEMGGAAARLHGIARWLAEYGHEVTVIAGFPNYPGGVFPDEYRGRLYAKEDLDGVQVIRTWVYASPKRGAIRRLGNYFSFVMSSFVAGLLVRRPTVIIASCPPLFIGITGWLLRILRRCKFVFDIRDMWPDVAVDAGEFRPDSFMTRWGNRLAKFLYRRADHIVPVTGRKLERIAAKGIAKEKLTIVSNGVDLDLVEPLTIAERDEIRTELGINDKLVVIYAGLIGIAQKVEMILGPAKRLADSNVHFVIVGDGARKELLEHAIADEGIDNITLLPRAQRADISRMLQSCDVAFVPLASSGLMDAVPSKLLEAWAHKLPVILVADGESRELVEACDGGFVYSPEFTDAIEEGISQYLGSHALQRRHARNGHRFVCENLSREELARKMEAVLEKVALGTRGSSNLRSERKTVSSSSH